MKSIFAFIIFYALSFYFLSLFRKIKSKKIIDKIRKSFDKNEQIIYAGWYVSSAIVLISLLYSVAGFFIFQNKIYELGKLGIIMFCVITLLSVIIVNIHFNQIIILTNISLYFTYGNNLKIDKILIKNIQNSKYIWLFRPFIDIKLNNCEYKSISHMTNSHKINCLINEMINDNKL